MDPTTSFNMNQGIKKSEAKGNKTETMGTVANNSPSPLFTTTTETAGTVASNNSSSSSCGVSYNA